MHIVSLLGLLWWRGFDVSETFSQKAARSNLSSVLYSLSFIAPFAFLYLFFTEWLMPQLGLPHAFYVVLLISLLFQIFCTFVPEKGGWMTTVHRTLTGISGAALLPLLAITALMGDITSLERMVCVVALLIMGWLLTFALQHQDGYKKALWLQIGYYGTFFLAILFVTYL